MIPPINENDPNLSGFVEAIINDFPKASITQDERKNNKTKNENFEMGVVPESIHKSFNL